MKKEWINIFLSLSFSLSLSLFHNKQTHTSEYNTSNGISKKTGPGTPDWAI